MIEIQKNAQNIIHLYVDYSVILIITDFDLSMIKTRANDENEQELLDDDESNAVEMSRHLKPFLEESSCTSKYIIVYKGRPKSEITQ